MDPETILKPGKLPPEILDSLIKEFSPSEDSLLIYPGVGEDIAAVRVRGEEVLVLKSDPITFATDRIGYYSILVNANDIATSGAVPKWLLVTLLLPVGIKLGSLWSVMEDLRQLCSALDIILCGGHTEITDAVNRPVISCSLLGTVAQKDLIRKDRINTGDSIILTKGVAVEGTSLLCREFEKKLLSLGMTVEEIERGKNYLEDISILKEAKIAAQSGFARGMHDVTEGGISSALLELSTVLGKRIEIKVENIPVFPETKKACRFLDLDPLGLIGSGSLLIGCIAGGEEELLALLKQGGVQAAVIGTVGQEGSGIVACRNGEPFRWPVFSADEITKLFS